MSILELLRLCRTVRPQAILLARQRLAELHYPMRRMLADYMERGFLENIIDMFKHDRGLYRHLPALMADERGRVRLGAVALVETLMELHRAEIEETVPSLAALLKDQSAVVRADTVYLLGIIGGRSALCSLKGAAGDEHEAVRNLISETIEELDGAE